jgi:hypothetical protein
MGWFGITGQQLCKQGISITELGFAAGGALYLPVLAPVYHRIKARIPLNPSSFEPSGRREIWIRALDIRGIKMVSTRPGS